MMRAFLLGVPCLVAGALVSGCGYSTQSSLPPEFQTIAVSPFYDQTPEYGLQAPLTNAITRKFIHDSRLEVVHPDQADLLLEGVILNYQLKGLTYDENDRVTQYLLVISAGVRLTDLRNGEVLWEDELMAGETSYYTRAAGQSSDRLRGNTEVFLPTVRSFASDEENRAAAEALEQLASDIFYRTVEPWPAS
jgi:hypothetical protein